MHSVKLLSAAILALGASTVSAATSTCTADVKITQPTQTVDCEVVNGDINISSDISGDVLIDGPKQVKGNFNANNASSVLSLKSTTINSITGTFSLQNLEKLYSIDFSSLKTVGGITLIKLPQLSSISFGTEGVTKIDSVRITDTFISDLTGLSVATVKDFQIDNNKQITKFDSDLVNITGSLIINNNGNDFEITMKKLKLAGEMQISNIKSFSAPILQKLTKSLKFDANKELTSFVAPNLTEITNDLSFINNVNLANLSLPVLETIAGGFTIQNNTLLRKIDGFDSLKNVSGGIIFRGNFTEIELPALKTVEGTVVITSTDDISDSCTNFDKLSKSKVIAGKYNCTSNNQKANEGGNGGDSSRSNSSSSDSKDSGSGSSFVSFTVLGLSALVAVAQLF